MNDLKHPFKIREVQYFEDSCFEDFQNAWDNDDDLIHVQSPSGRFLYNSDHELILMELYCYVPDFNDYFVEVK